MTTPMPQVRETARVIVMDREDRLLLFLARLGERPIWLTPGGGVEAGETFLEAAVRERYYLLRCERFEVSNANHTAEELRIVEGHRWWHPAEIMASKDWFAPRELGRYVTELFERGVPLAGPIELERRGRVVSRKPEVRGGFRRTKKPSFLGRTAS